MTASLHDPVCTTWPVCPACGHVHRDAWEWDMGEEVDERRCDKCEAHLIVTRVITASYTTKLREE